MAPTVVCLLKLFCCFVASCGPQRRWTRRAFEFQLACSLLLSYLHCNMLAKLTHTETQTHSCRCEIFYTCVKYKSYFCKQFAQTIWFVVLCKFICNLHKYGCILEIPTNAVISLFNWPKTSAIGNCYR